PTPPANLWVPPRNPQKATRLCHQTGIDGGMFFLPLRWTERIGSCRANAMVVPTGWFELLHYLIFGLVYRGLFCLRNIPCGRLCVSFAFCV
ncbi:MAG: hypothetical protein NTW61_04375, partial [Candidatus Melainabacteria bacterium]|nr:hypothetical protein [Candidatus Melainabacteria bacterium]